MQVAKIAGKKTYCKNYKLRFEFRKQELCKHLCAITCMFCGNLDGMKSNLKIILHSAILDRSPYLQVLCQMASAKSNLKEHTPFWKLCGNIDNFKCNMKGHNLLDHGHMGKLGF